MSDWEFLLQKEGDQTWLPLESADVEILEGRYRIVANTHLPHTEVQIRIIHDSTEEIPPVRRVQKRSSRTHSQGLIAIIPFTRLKPGKWEFRCQARLTTSSPQPKPHIVHLQVLPTEYEVSDFSQLLDETEAQYAAADSEQRQNYHLITNKYTDKYTEVFPGKLDIDEVAINAEANIGINPDESAQFEPTKSDEIELFDDQIKAQLKLIESLAALPLVDERKEQNLQTNNQLDPLTHLSTKPTMMSAENETEASIKNTENQLIAPTEILENQPSTLAQVNQDPETKTDAIADPSVSSIAQTNSPVNQPLQLTLDQASYIAQPGEALIISGQVIPLIQTPETKQSTAGFEKIYKTHSTKTDIPQNNAPIINGNLQICLRNPQSSEVLIDIQQPLPEQVPPIIFACTLSLPENIKSRLVLGQIILTNDTTTLANKSFTITAPLQNWLEAIDDNFVEDEHQAVTPEVKKPVQKPPSFLDLVEKINPTQPQQTVDVDRPLPDQIYKPAEGGSDLESPELPVFGNPLPNKVAKDTPKINDLLPKSESPGQSDAQDDVWADSDSPPEQTKLQPETDELESETADNDDVPNIKQNLVPFPTKFAPRKKAFKALNLEDRFFSRLNSLINDSELSQWMKASPDPPTEETDSTKESQKAPESTKHQAETKVMEDNDSISMMVDDEELKSQNPDEIDWEAQEFVVEDESPEQLLPQQQKEWSSPSVNIPRQQDESISTQPYVLPTEQPLPVPDLEVLGNVVIAGRKIKVRVQLPDALPRIYVKIWVYDRQAQAIVAGPSWLTDFIPNGMGQVEAIADLEIAYGCLEVKFEAIAVEMQTNRESHKAVVERLVVPPPPPTLPFDNLS